MWAARKIGAAGSLQRRRRIGLEAKSSAELARERMRHDHAAGLDKASRLLERGGPHVGTEVRAEVSPVGKIERLEEAI